TTRAQNLTTSFTYTPTRPARTETISFNATATGGSPPYSFSWAFGDSITATGSTVSHSYSSSGTYTVTLAVTDSLQQQTLQAQNIIITNYHPFSFGIASDIGNIGIGYSDNSFYAPRQSLLRLGRREQTTGTSQWKPHLQRQQAPVLGRQPERPV